MSSFFIFIFVARSPPSTESFPGGTPYILQLYVRRAYKKKEPWPSEGASASLVDSELLISI